MGNNQPSNQPTKSLTQGRAQWFCLVKSATIESVSRNLLYFIPSVCLFYLYVVYLLCVCGGAEQTAMN